MYEDVHNQLIKKLFYFDNIICLDFNTMYTHYKYNTQIHFYIFCSDLCRLYKNQYIIKMIKLMIILCIILRSFNMF